MATTTRGRCGLCLRDNVERVASHIFPRWIGREIQPTGPLLHIPADHGSAPSFVVAHGDYDRIVCGACEIKFGPADDYFADFSRQRSQGKWFGSGEETFGYEFVDANADLIQRFALTCLFRAHLSSRPLWDGVDLGGVGERLRAALRSESPLTQAFPVVLYRETHELAQMLTPPVRLRVEHVNAYTFSVPGFGFLVIVDRQAPPELIARAAVGATPVVTAWAADDTSGLLEAMRRARRLYGAQLDRMTRRHRSG
jgi:hypothetical protein